MADDIGNYNFDFKKEVDDLRRSLGARAMNLLFAEVDVNQTERDAPRINVEHMIGRQSSNDLIRANLAYEYEQNPEKTSERGKIEGVDVICLRKQEPIAERFGEKNIPLMRLFTLYHETAHSQISGPAVDDDHPFQECAADAYAAIRFLQRFGQAAGPFLSMMSWGRSLKAVACLDSSHLTTTVLDKIITDGARHDFSRLTADETIELAKKYAREWTPNAAVLADMRSVIARTLVNDKIDLSKLYTTCLATPNNFAFYIGAKFFQPLLHPDGVVLNGQTIQLEAPYRQKYAAAIEERGGGKRRIFNDVATQRQAAVASFAETLKVSRPAGHKKFIVNI